MAGNNNVILSLGTDAAKQIADLEKLNAKYKQLVENAGKAKKQHDDISDVTNKTAGIMGGLIGKVAQWGPALAPVGLAMAAIRQDMEKTLALQEKVSQSVKSSAIDYGTMAQVATSAKDFQAMKAGAGFLSAAAGISEQQAVQTRTAMRNAGLDNELNTVVRISRLANPVQAINSIATMQSAFGGAAGTPENIMNQMIFAGGQSKFDLNQISGAAASLGATSAQAGSTLPEMLASLAIAGQSAKSIDTAADRIKAFLSWVSNPDNPKTRGTLGRKLNEARGQIAKAKVVKDYLNGKDPATLFGASQEAKEGYILLSKNISGIESLAANTAGPGSANLLETRSGFIATDPTLAAESTARMVEQQAIQFGQTEGQIKLRKETVENAILAERGQRAKAIEIAQRGRGGVQGVLDWMSQAASMDSSFAWELARDELNNPSGARSKEDTAFLRSYFANASIARGQQFFGFDTAGMFGTEINLASQQELIDAAQKNNAALEAIKDASERSAQSIDRKSQAPSTANSGTGE